jgi:hypothetical protein
VSRMHRALPRGTARFAGEERQRRVQEPRTAAAGLFDLRGRVAAYWAAVVGVLEVQVGMRRKVPSRVEWETYRVVWLAEVGFFLEKR